MRTLAQKMGIKESCRSIFINAPAEAMTGINHPGIDNQTTLNGEFDYIHLFVITKNSQEELFPMLKSHLKLDGMLWVSWPKNKQLDTDLTLPVVIKIGYSFGLVESTCLSINKTWSALKFTHPKKGKIYSNRHAELKERTTNR
ncbi:MAG: hypothetical protein EHM20_13955 [Alphaproteobacteria bacterium]|nr:MAG: hypothetical protein EHM20_13955 [Alphaproteobacteria bacterium]